MRLPTSWPIHQHSVRAARFAINPARRTQSTRFMPSINAALVAACLAMVTLQAMGQPSPPFAGSETCGMCHEDIAKAFAKSPHHLVDGDKKRGWDGRACESCHGAGKAHAESGDAKTIQNPAKLAAAA